MKRFDWGRFFDGIYFKRIFKDLDLKRFTNGLANNKTLLQLENAARGLLGSKSKVNPLGQQEASSSVLKRPSGRPPKLVTTDPVALRDLTPREILQRNILAFVAVTMAMFLSNLFVFSHIQHASSQELLRASFTDKLALATAPTSEGDENLILLADGTPVAYIEIPEIGVGEVVVEGTDSTALRSGPGHRRDTVLPGQNGTSVIMGRSSAFGGPFASIHTLKPGTLFSVVTGQGQHTYKVIGMRYAGEPEPAPATEGVSRLVLETGRGLPYSPSGVTRVDAQMISTSLTYSPSKLLTGQKPCFPATPSPTPSVTPPTFPSPSSSASPSPGAVGQSGQPVNTSSPEASRQPEDCATPSSTPSESESAVTGSPTPSVSQSATPTGNGSETPQPVATPVSEIATGSNTFDNNVVAFASGARLTSAQTLPLEHRALASDVTTVWALVFALQFLILVEILVIWSVRRFGLRKAWVAGIPVVLLASILASDQLIRLLPNLT